MVCMIQSFRCKSTQTVFEGECLQLFSAIQAVAERKLAQLEAAQTLDFLHSPPGNRLEKLTGDREGQWNIRMNAQWCICFTWSDLGPADVEIVDYH